MILGGVFMSFVVAIDGPAGSGKGTVAKIIAQKFGFVNIDTGAMYRCVTLECIRNNIKLTEQEKVKLDKALWELIKEGKIYYSFLDKVFKKW